MDESRWTAFLVVAILIALPIIGFAVAFGLEWLPRLIWHRPTVDPERARAEVLICFCVPRPVDLRDLEDRAITIAGAARSILNIPRDAPVWGIGPERFEAYERKREELQDAAEAMLADNLLVQPKPDTDPDHKPPPGVYQLTHGGAIAAMAVLQRAEEGAKG